MSASAAMEIEATEPIDILIVDDSPEDIAGIRRQLKSPSLGKFVIRECPSAVEALRECRLRKPDCVLLDMRMPQLDGLGFLERLKEAGAIDFPIIVLTIYGQEDLGARAIQSGAQDFLVKDQTTPESLSRAISHARERFRMTRDLAAAHKNLLQANLEVTRNLAQLEAIFSQSAVGVAQTSLDGSIMLVNDAFCRVTGFSREDLVTRNLQNIAGPLVVLTAGHAEGEKLYRKSDGSSVWVQESICLADGKAGEPASYVVLISDITKRKNAEAAQSLLASLVEATADAVSYQDVNGIIRTWNSGAEKTYGFTAEEVIGKPFEILVPSDKLEELHRLRDDAANGVPAQGIETTRIRKNGCLLPVAVTVSGVRNNSGELTGYSTISRDISNRKQAEQALEASEVRYRSLANAMPQIVYAANAEGETEFINEQWLGYTGSPAAEALGGYWVNWIHAEDRDRTLSQWNQSIGTGTKFEIEHRLRNKDGEYEWHLSRAIPIKDEAGRVTGWNGTCTYIHQQKLVEEKLRQSEERLRLAHSSAGLVAWDLDLVNDRYTEMPEFYELFELESGRNFGVQDWLARVHPADRERFLNPSESSVDTEFRLVRKDGAVRWLMTRGRFVFDKSGRPVRVMGISIDITERKRAECALRESRERLHLALKAGKMGVWEWNLADNTVRAPKRLPGCSIGFKHLGPGKPPRHFWRAFMAPIARASNPLSEPP